MGNQRLCSVEGCESPCLAKGFCNRHYKRWQSHGTPHVPSGSRDARERFAVRYRVVETGCWEWTGALNSYGYGRVSVEDRDTGAHRLSYEIHLGPIPDGLQIDHICRNRKCVNPAHLEAVTGAENNRRKAAAVTHCPSGHPYDETNTIRSKSGARSCKVCVRASQRASKRRKREAVSC